jgi:NADPH:quinone reductase-like Zn-dependent oxidoreductase
MLRSGTPAVVSARPTAGSARCVTLGGFGPPEMLRVASRAVPAPGPGEVRIRHTAIGVNFIDIYCRTGLFDLVQVGGVPGLEAAGVVTDSGVAWLRTGDRVAYAGLPPGAYAAERTMPADLVLPLPDDVTEETAAAGLLKGMTAAFLLHEVHRVRAGQSVLVHAAAGGTGMLLCQWARALGANVIGLVSSDAKARVARAHGCTHPLVLGAQDVPQAVRELTQGRGADVVYDGVGAAGFDISFAALAVRGHIVSFGQASGEVPPRDVSAWAAKSATVSRPNFGHYTGTRAAAQRLADMLWDAVRRGVLRIPEPQRFALDRAADAHRALESRATTGPLVLIP